MAMKSLKQSKKESTLLAKAYVKENIGEILEIVAKEPLNEIREVRLPDASKFTPNGESTPTDEMLSLLVNHRAFKGYYSRFGKLMNGRVYSYQSDWGYWYGLKLYLAVGFGISAVSLILKILVSNLA